MAQPAQHHGERCEPEVRFRLAAAGGEEQEVHELALGIRGGRDAGQVQQQKGELEGTPTGRAGHPFTGQPPSECGGDGAVRDAEGVERVRILRQDADAPFHAVGGGTGVEHQLIGRLAAFARQAGERRVLLIDPGAVTGHQRRQRSFGVATIGEIAEHRHGKLDTRHLHGLGRLHLGCGNPGGPEHPAGVVYQLPVRGHAVTGRVLGCIGVMEVCHTFVRIIACRPTRIGTRHERNGAPHLQLGLESERLVAGRVFGRGAARSPGTATRIAYRAEYGPQTS